MKRMRTLPGIASMLVMVAMLMPAGVALADVPESGEVIAVYPERRVVVIDGREYRLDAQARVVAVQTEGTALGTRELPLHELARGMRVTYTLSDRDSRPPEIRYLNVLGD